VFNSSVSPTSVKKVLRLAIASFNKSSLSEASTSQLVLNQLATLSQLPITAREAHILPGLAHSSLVSIGKLCDVGCEAKFDNQEVVITKNNINLLRGQRDRCTGLWRIPLTNNEESTITLNRPTMECNNATTIPPNKMCSKPDATIGHNTVCYNAYQHHKIPEVIQYLHAAAFSPVPSTWIAAIQRRFYQSWPGLTAAAVRKHLPKSEATTKGHLDQTRKNLRSTNKTDDMDLKKNKSRTIRKLIRSSQQSETPPKYTPPKYTPTKPDGSPSHPVKATSTSLYCMSTIRMPS
jgi:hypothetical protein